MTDLVLPDRPLSIWQPVHLGTDEFGRRVGVTLAGRNMILGGEPGAGSLSACNWSSRTAPCRRIAAWS